MPLPESRELRFARLEAIRSLLNMFSDILKRRIERGDADIAKVTSRIFKTMHANNFSGLATPGTLLTWSDLCVIQRFVTKHNIALALFVGSGSGAVEAFVGTFLAVCCGVKPVYTDKGYETGGYIDLDGANVVPVAKMTCANAVRTFKADVPENGVLVICIRPGRYDTVGAPFWPLAELDAAELRPVFYAQYDEAPPTQSMHDLVSFAVPTPEGTFDRDQGVFTAGKYTVESTEFVPTDTADRVTHRDLPCKSLRRWVIARKGLKYTAMTPPDDPNHTALWAVRATFQNDRAAAARGMEPGPSTSLYDFVARCICSDTGGHFKAGGITHPIALHEVDVHVTLNSPQHSNRVTLRFMKVRPWAHRIGRSDAVRVVGALESIGWATAARVTVMAAGVRKDITSVLDASMRWDKFATQTAEIYALTHRDTVLSCNDF